MNTQQLETVVDRLNELTYDEATEPQGEPWELIFALEVCNGMYAIKLNDTTLWGSEEDDSAPEDGHTPETLYQHVLSSCDKLRQNLTAFAHRARQQGVA